MRIICLVAAVRGGVGDEIFANLLGCPRWRARQRPATLGEVVQSKAWAV